MKVLVIPSWYPDGEDKLMGIYHKEYARAIAASGLDVDMLCVFRERIKYPIKYLIKKKFQIYHEDGYDVYMLRMLDLEKINLKLQMNLYYKKLEKLFKRYVKEKGMPDVLHAEVTIPAGYAVSRLGKKYGIPVLTTEHASGFMQYFRAPYTEYGNYVLENSKFSTVSNLMKEELGKADTLVLPNVIDTKSFYVDRKKNNDNMRLITVSAFRKGKGNEYLIKALDILINEKKIKNVHLDIVGDGYLMDFYKSKSEELNLMGYITFHGQKNKAEIRDLLGSANIYVIPSNYESFCITGVEALASGLPVVSTKCFGPQEYLDDKCSVLCEVKNSESMANAILELWNKIDKYDVKYLRKVADKYSYEEISKKARKIYESLLKTK